MAESTASFRFNDFRLESLQFNQRSGRPASGELTYGISFRGDHQVIEGQERAARVRLGVALRWKGDPPFDLDIEASGQFNWTEDCQGEDLERMLRGQAPALIYTQIRPIVRLLAAEAGFTGFLLPTHNFLADPVEP